MKLENELTTTDIQSIRSEYLHSRIGVKNIISILSLHCLLIIWLIIGQVFWGHSLVFVFGSMIICAVHQRQTSEWLHEGLHFNIHPSKKINEFICNWFLSSLLGVPVKQMRQAHFRHHSADSYFSEDDHETNFANVSSQRELLICFLKDISGISALSNYFSFIFAKKSTPKANVLNLFELQIIKQFFPILVVQLFLISISFYYSAFSLYLIFYASLVCVYPVLSRLRLYGQHLRTNKDGSSVTFQSTTSRTVDGGILDRIFISSKLMQFHNQHHSYPALPFRALETIVDKSEKDNNKYIKSHWPIFRALLKVGFDE